MKSHSSDENTGYNQTTTTNTYLNDHNHHHHHHLNGNTFNYHQQQHRVDSKHNLKLEHFKFSHYQFDGCFLGTFPPFLNYTITFFLHNFYFQKIIKTLFYDLKKLLSL